MMLQFWDKWRVIPAQEVLNIRQMNRNLFDNRERFSNFTGACQNRNRYSHGVKYRVRSRGQFIRRLVPRDRISKTIRHYRAVSPERAAGISIRGESLEIFRGSSLD